MTHNDEQSTPSLRGAQRRSNPQNSNNTGLPFDSGLPRSDGARNDKAFATTGDDNDTTKFQLFRDYEPGEISDFNDDGKIDNKDKTLLRFVKIALNAFSGVVLVGLLVFVLLANSVISLPPIEYNSGTSSVNVPTFTSNSVCFSAPTIDKDVSNDEEFGGKKSETISSTKIAALGNSSSPTFEPLSPSNDSSETTPSPDNSGVNDSGVDTSDDGSKIVTANNSDPNADVFSTIFSETDTTAFAVEGTKTSYTPDGDLKGFAVTKCVPPQTDFYFLGGATYVQNTTKLFLANPTNSPAQVMITVWGDNTSAGVGDDGSLKYTASRYIGVDAKSEKSVLLSSGAPDQKIIGLHVSSNATPISATVSTNALSGITPNGIEYVNAQKPASQQVIPAFQTYDTGAPTTPTPSETGVPATDESDGGDDAQANETDASQAAAASGKHTSTLSIISPSAKSKSDVRVKFINQLPEVKPIEKTVKLDGAKVSLDELGDLPAGIWTAIIEADSDILATIEDKVTYADGTQEIAFYNPAELGENVVTAVNGANSVNIYRNDDTEYTDDELTFLLIGYNLTGNFIFNREVSLKAGALLTLSSADLQGAEFINVQAHLKRYSEDNPYAEGTLGQVLGVSSTWNDARGIANATGSVVATKLDQYTFRFDTVG